MHGRFGHLQLVDRYGDSLEWTVVPNQRGRRNAIVYGPDRIRLVSFYFYLVDQQPRSITIEKPESFLATTIENLPRTDMIPLQSDLVPDIGGTAYHSGFKRHRDADQQIASAITVIKAILPLRLYPGHLKQFLSRALWKITEAEAGGRSGKLRIRYRSKESLSPTHGKLQHEHVYQQREMIEELIAHPDRVEEIVSKAIACVVTKEEHRRLHRIARSVDGWARYLQTGIVVVDTATGEIADLNQLAAEARLL